MTVTIYEIKGDSMSGAQSNRQITDFEELPLSHRGSASKSSTHSRRQRSSRPSEARNRLANVTCPHEHQNDTSTGGRDDCCEQPGGKQADRSCVHRDGVQPAPDRSGGGPL